MNITSVLKSLLIIAVLAFAGPIHAQPFPFDIGWNREAVPDAVIGGSVDINYDTTDPCVWSLKNVSIEVDSFSAFGEIFSYPIWSSTTWSNCIKLPDDLIPMGPLGGASGIDGIFRLIYNLNGYPNCTTGTALTLTGGSSSAVPDDWTCGQLILIAFYDWTIGLAAPQSIKLVLRGIDGSISNSMRFDVY